MRFASAVLVALGAAVSIALAAPGDEPQPRLIAHDVVLDKSRQGALVVVAEVLNDGRATAWAGTPITAFDDVNGNAKFDAATDRMLGTGRLAAPLRAGGVATVLIRIALPPDATAARRVRVGADVSDTAAPIAVEAPPEFFAEDFGRPPLPRSMAVANQDGYTTHWRHEDEALEADGGGGLLLWTVRRPDYDVEVKVSFPASVSNDAGLLFAARDANHWHQLRVDAERVRLIALDRGRLQTLAETPTEGQRARRWYTLKVQVRGVVVRGFVDGMLVIEHRGVTDPLGAAGVMQDRVRARYDDFVVRPARSDAPLSPRLRR